MEPPHPTFSSERGCCLWTALYRTCECTSELNGEGCPLTGCLLCYLDTEATRTPFTMSLLHFPAEKTSTPYFRAWRKPKDLHWLWKGLGPSCVPHSVRSQAVHELETFTSSQVARCAHGSAGVLGKLQWRELPVLEVESSLRSSGTILSCLAPGFWCGGCSSSRPGVLGTN